MSAYPFVGSVMRERSFSSVDLPAPFRPMIATASPSLMSNVRSSTAQMDFFPCRRSRRLACIIAVSTWPTRYRLLSPCALIAISLI